MSKAKTVLLYILKSGIVFALIYFSVIEPTALSMLFFLLVVTLGGFGLIVCGLLLVGIVFLLSKIPNVSKEGEGVFRRHFMRPLIIALGTAAMFGVYFAGLSLSEAGETARIKRDIAEADAVFQYGTGTFYGSGIKGIDTIHSLITVNYEKKKVTFLIDSVHKYETVALKEGVHTCGGIVQKELDMPAPGAKLITYYPVGGSDRPDSEAHRTCAVELIMADGTVYSASDLKDQGTNYPEWFGLAPYEEVVPVPDKNISKSYRSGGNPFA